MTFVPFIIYLGVKLLKRDIRQDNRVKGLQIKIHSYKLHAFADDLVLILQSLLENIEYTLRKIKMFGEMVENK